MSLTSEEIFAADDMPQPREIDVPEWGGSVFIRMLPVGDRGKWEERCFDHEGKPKMAMRAISVEALVAMVCDHAGVPIFQSDDVVKLSLKHPDVVERLALEATLFNKLDVTSAEQVEKNLPETQTSDSSTN